MFADDTLPLFDDPAHRPGTDAEPRAGRPGSDGVDPAAPLAERMRPHALEEVLGQDHLLGADGTLRKLLEAGHLPSLILHGPPGTGKTTLARLMAERVGASFVPFSAVSEGVPRLREVVKEAQARRGAGGRTLLFVDEIHRLNKGQQDFLLPHVESGLVTLVGATTEHPAFEVNPALLSRARVLVLNPLGEADLLALARRALETEGRGLGETELRLAADGADALVRAAGGDARQLLGVLEIAARLAPPASELGEQAIREAAMRQTPRYDASLAFQMLSAFHKSLRASDADAALYWGMRMIRGGEDPLVLLRRVVAAAYEDVGLADPRAGMVAVQAMQAFERLGPPEGYLPLANAIVYVAQAPKSNRAYLALKAATAAADEHPDAPVPLHLRNASTWLMREWGYQEGYRYAHDYEGGHTEMQCLPDSLTDAHFYRPGDEGFEAEVLRRMVTRKPPEP
jgi:putative ATPase